MLGGSFCRKYVVSILEGEGLMSLVWRGELIQAFVSLAVTLVLMAGALFLSAARSNGHTVCGSWQRFYSSRWLRWHGSGA